MEARNMKALMLVAMLGTVGCGGRALDIASASASPQVSDILEARCNACHFVMPAKAAFALADADAHKDDIAAVVTASDGHHPRVFVESDEVDALLLWAASR
jgi:hypothetical protein